MNTKIAQKVKIFENSNDKGSTSRCKACPDERILTQTKLDLFLKQNTETPAALSNIPRPIDYEKIRMLTHSNPVCGLTDNSLCSVDGLAPLPGRERVKNENGSK